jgi:hypothetical protein
MRFSPAALRSRGPWACQIALALVVLTACAVAAASARLLSGPWGPAAAGVSALSCWFGAAAALAATTMLARHGNGLAGLLAGMAFRMAIPLASVVVFHLVGGPLVQAGLLYYFLFFYPLTLAVETALSLPQPRDSRPFAGPPTTTPLARPRERGRG